MPILPEQQGTPPVEAQQPQGQGEVDPQIQQQITEGYRIGKNILYKEDPQGRTVFDGIVETLQSTEPVQALAEVLVSVVRKIDEAMQLTQDAALGIGLLLAGDLVDAFEETGQATFSQEQVAQAIQLAVEMYLNLKGTDKQQMAMEGQQLQATGG